MSRQKESKIKLGEVTLSGQQGSFDQKELVSSAHYPFLIIPLIISCDFFISATNSSFSVQIGN